MTYKLVNSKEVIARVANSYIVDRSDWILKSPLWIYDAIADIGCIASMENVKQDLTIANYMTKLPCDMKLIIAVRYNDCRLPRIGSTELEFDDSIKWEIHTTEYYTINNNNYMETSFAEGTVTLYYKKSPVEFDDTWNINLPLIPDNNKLKVALEWYIAMRILQSGGRIEGLSLRERNEFTNPALQWERHRKKAQNSVSSMDKDERDKVSRLLRTFLIDEDPNQFNVE